VRPKELWADEAAIVGDAPLLKRLQGPKDWIIGFVVGVVGGLAAVLRLSRRVPKIKISRTIAIDHGIYKIKASKGGAPLVAMMQTAHLREGDGLACGGRLDWARLRTILVE
jgi:hypothetical protein